MIVPTSGAKVIDQPHLMQVYDMTEAMFDEFLEFCTPPIITWMADFASWRPRASPLCVDVARG